MNKHIGDVDNGLFQLEVHECGCGFHIGVDATYLDQVGKIIITCPSCKEEIVVEAFDDEDEGEEVVVGEQFEINSELVLSTSHITESDATILEDRENKEFGITAPDEHHWRININATRAFVAEAEGYSPAYAHLLRLAFEKGCRWLVLHTDGPVSNDLPTFEW